MVAIHPKHSRKRVRPRAVGTMIEALMGLGEGRVPPPPTNRRVPRKNFTILSANDNVLLQFYRISIVLLRNFEASSM